MISILKRLFFGQPPSPEEMAADHDALARAEARRDSMVKPAVRLAVEWDVSVPNEPVSSLGGRPSLTSADAWPCDDGGKQMVFLAQINFAEMPPIAAYPTEGLLSFFVPDGVPWGFHQEGTGFCVIWREAAEGLVRVDLPNSKPQGPYGGNLAREGVRIVGHPAEGYPTTLSREGYALGQEWGALGDTAMQDGFFDNLESRKPGAVYFGGYPAFVQEDFRDIWNWSENDPTEVLIQIGHLSCSVGGKSRPDWDIEWGDAGEACFLISKADLAARKFDRVAYNWDCH